MQHCLVKSHLPCIFTVLHVCTHAVMLHLQDEEEGWMEKDELPSAQEQMGLYHRQQTRQDDNDISLEELQNYVKQRFETPAQRYSEVCACLSLLTASYNSDCPACYSTHATSSKQEGAGTALVAACQQHCQYVLCVRICVMWAVGLMYVTVCFASGVVPCDVGFGQCLVLLLYIQTQSTKGG